MAVAIGSAARTNTGADAHAKNLGRAGKVSAVTGVVLGGARIALADDKVFEITRVGGGALGGIAAGAFAGTRLGAMGANPLTIAGGALIGAVIGGIAGEKAVDVAIGRVGSSL